MKNILITGSTDGIVNYWHWPFSQRGHFVAIHEEMQKLQINFNGNKDRI